MKLRHRSDWLLLIAPTERPIPESRWQTCRRASGTCQLLGINQTKEKKKTYPLYPNFGSLGFCFYFLSRRMKGNATVHHPTFPHPTQGLIHTHTHTTKSICTCLNCLQRCRPNYIYYYLFSHALLFLFILLSVLAVMWGCRGFIFPV